MLRTRCHLIAYSCVLHPWPYLSGHFVVVCAALKIANARPACIRCSSCSIQSNGAVMNVVQRMAENMSRVLAVLPPSLRMLVCSPSLRASTTAVLFVSCKCMTMVNDFPLRTGFVWMLAKFHWLNTVTLDRGWWFCMRCLI